MVKSFISLRLYIIKKYALLYVSIYTFWSRKMKGKIGLIMIPSLLVMNPAKAFFCDWDFSPYVGADIQRRHLSFPTNNGSNVFKKNARQGNVYLGTKFNNCLGLEVGYENTAKTSRNVRLVTGQFEVGGAPLGLAFQDTYGATRLYGWHIDLMGYYPLLSCYPLELVGSVGLARLKAKLISTALVDEVAPVVFNPSRNFVQKRTVARITGGLQYTFPNCMGIRATVGFENTNRFKHITARETADPNVFATMKNSFIYSIGGFVYF